jgi:hypothetical protein
LRFHATATEISIRKYSDHFLGIIDTPAGNLCPLDIQDPEPMRQRLMDPLDNRVGEKRLGVRHHMRKIGDIGRHPIEDFGRGSFAKHSNKFDPEHGRLLFALCQ